MIQRLFFCILDDILPSEFNNSRLANDQNPQDLQYMILVYFNEGETQSGQKVKRSFYIFPKHLSNTGAKDIGVIGGTFIEGATPKTPNEKEFDILLEGAKKFYGIQ